MIGVRVYAASGMNGIDDVCVALLGSVIEWSMTEAVECVDFCTMLQQSLHTRSAPSLAATCNPDRLS